VARDRASNRLITVKAPWGIKDIMNFVRVLVPIDFSEASLEALNVARERFAGGSNILTLLHVIESGLGLIDPQNELQQTDIETSRHRLASLGRLQEGAWKEVSALVEAGKPVDCILDTANREHTDLVIMGSHGSGGLRRALFGSTTYDVARKLKCSVMVTKTA
jgi:nucleotide-binding universal stress UspA family protein